MNNLCLNCNLLPAKNKFCSRSCSASYNNSIIPRRKPEHKCIVCGKPTPATKRICSKDCRDEKYNLHTTIGELKSKSVRDAQVYNTLRQRSRRIALQTMVMECQEEACNWTEHVEVCHIKALCDLDDSTTVAQATGHWNFILLCPNHHWKFDHDEEYGKTYRNIWEELYPKMIPRTNALVVGIEPTTESHRMR